MCRNALLPLPVASPVTTWSPSSGSSFTHQAITPFPIETALKIFRAMISTATVSEKQNMKENDKLPFFFASMQAGRIV